MIVIFLNNPFIFVNLFFKKKFLCEVILRLSVKYLLKKGKSMFKRILYAIGKNSVLIGGVHVTV